MRRAIIAAVLGVVSLVLPASASASFHLMKITEVGNANPADYVELQMYSSGENFVKDHFIRTYDETGAVRGTFQFPNSVVNGGNQRTILIGRDEAVDWPVEPDFKTDQMIITGDGAVCYLDTLILPPLDCVSYGSFAPASLVLPTGTPAPQIPSGIGANTLQRSIEPGCATLLEAGDDTNDSATDFALAPPTPRNNKTVPTEKGCDTTPPETTINKHPKKRSTKRAARFTFSASERGSSFECKLDGGSFEPCDSPFRKRVKPGKHRFAVVAIDRAGNRDPSPAKAAFRRVRKR
jgi:hypothetical protein